MVRARVMFHGMQGYSDRINHALAFAAKHHDRQVHKGMRPPYRMHSAMVAIVLARYNQPDSTVIAGILHDAVEDSVSARESREMLEQRVASKFGTESLETALSITHRVTDDDGLEFSHEERRDDLLERLADAGEPARWVCAAGALYEASATVASLRRTIDPDSVWSALPLGRQGTLSWFRRLHDRLESLGFTAPIMTELGGAIDELHRLVAAEDASDR